MGHDSDRAALIYQHATRDGHGDFLAGTVFGIAPRLPAWVQLGKPTSRRLCQLVLKSGSVDLADPTTLRAVPATTTDKRPAGVYDGVRTTLYQGSITFAQLSKAKPGLRIGFRSKPTGRYGTWKVSRRLWIGGDRLVRRAWSSWREPNDSRDRSVSGDPYYAFVEDLRLSDWGMKVHIVPPPADETVPVEELID
ncbi:hypothetical protein [Nonomuraea sp. NPDC003201]